MHFSFSSVVFFFFFICVRKCKNLLFIIFFAFRLISFIKFFFFSIIANQSKLIRSRGNECMYLRIFRLFLFFILLRKNMCVCVQQKWRNVRRIYRLFVALKNTKAKSMEKKVVVSNLSWHLAR